MAAKSTRMCPTCGRGIVTGHNLSERNWIAHQEACPKQQAKKYRMQQRKAARRTRDGVGSSTPPGIGQFGFPFEGIPEEVTA